MKFLLNQIKKSAQNKPFKFDEEIDVSELEALDNDIRKMKPVRVQGECTLDDEQVIFSLCISGEMTLPCARTLVDVPYFFTINETEIFSFSPYRTEDDIENEIFPIEGEMIDLRPIIEENILLAVPFRVFSEDEDAIKNAILKGDGWDYFQEADENEKQEKTIDPRLKKLQSLLDNKEKEK